MSYLNSIGLSDAVINKYFFQSSVGKFDVQPIHGMALIQVTLGSTLNKTLSTYNASADKYKYDKNNIGGILTPYDDAKSY